jgi:putative transcriptional regulator
MTDTKIKHHLPDDILLGYSAGTLPEAFSLMVAAHVSLCDACRAEVEAYDALGGALIEEAGEALSPDALQKAMALIARGDVAEPPRRRAPGVLPGPLQDYVGGDLDAIRWRPVGMGVKQAILKTDGTATARLLMIPAGAAMPDHGHKGTELTMVLKGAFVDGADRFARGDVEMADEDLAHTPVADIGEDCICLAVTDAPLKFKGLLPRIAQPFLRI